VVPTGGVRATHATQAIAIAATKAIARIARPRSTLAAMSSTRHMAAESRSALVSVMVRDGSIPRVNPQRAAINAGSLGSAAIARSISDATTGPPLTSSAARA